MTYAEAQLEAFNSIEASNEAVIKTMAANYEKALAELQNDLNKLYASLATLKKEDWYNYVIKTNRLNDLITDFTRKYNVYDGLANEQAYDIIKQSMLEGYYKSQYVNIAFIPETVSLTVLPKNLLEACITGQAEAIKKITDDIIEKYGSLSEYVPQYGTLKGLLKEQNLSAISEIQQVITQGILKGQSIKDLTKNVEQTFETITWKAQRIARTEALRTASVGQYAATKELESTGSNVKKMWLCNMDMRTRSSHRQLDGKKIGVNDKFKINGHSALYPRGFGIPSEDINCRCTIVNIVDDTPPQTRTAYNPITRKKEIFTFKTYTQWFNENKLGEIYN